MVKLELSLGVLVPHLIFFNLYYLFSSLGNFYMLSFGMSEWYQHMTHFTQHAFKALTALPTSLS